MKVLIVEDNIKLGENLKQGLNQEGYAVELVADGLSAFKSKSQSRRV